jgi:hypothetical protein
LKSSLLKLLLILILTFAWQVFPQEENTESKVAPLDSASQKTKEKKNPRGAMLRSVFVPGWGQFYNGKWFKGIIVAGTETGIIINSIVQNELAKNSITSLEREFYLDNRNLSYWWLAGAILYSAVDAFVDAHLFDFDESPDLSLNLVPYKQLTDLNIQTGPQLCLEWRF